MSRSKWAGWWLIFILSAVSVSASHFRFGNIAWRRAAGATNSLTVEITVVEAWRANSSGTGEIDYAFGDGSGSFTTGDAVLVSELTDVAGEGYKIWTHTVTHTYPSNGVYTVSGDSCCRISSLINAGSDSETLTAVVDLQASNTGSPVTSSSVILQMQTGRSNAVVLPIADPDGDAFAVRLATAAESEIGSIAAIGTNVLTVTPQGVVQWDTTSGNNGAKYAVQVVVEENHGGGGPGRVPLDFIIELVGTVNNSAPTCTGPAGTIRTGVGAQVALSFQAIDPEGRPLRVDHQGLPPGATLTPAPGTTNASASLVTFNWTPTASQSGQSFPVIILFTDDGGLQAQCAFALTVAAGPPDFDLVSVKAGGSGSGGAGSANPGLSADGNLVVFASRADDLVAGDGNGETDIFLRDRTLRRTELISVTANGGSASEDSQNPVISRDGRYVAFQSRASDLVSGDNNGRIDVFVRDRTLGQTVLVSVDSGGNSSGSGDSYSPRFTADGRKVAFASTADNLVTNDNNGTADAFVRDLATGVTVLASVNTNGVSGNGISGPPVITPDGRYVAFLSAAGDLVGNDTNGLNDAYRRDLVSGVTELASGNPSGQAGNRLSFHPVISSDGRRVAFATQATDLTATPDANNVTDVCLRDFSSNATIVVSRTPDRSGTGNSASGTPVFGGDGDHLLFISIASDLAANDTNGKQDVFLWRAATGSNELISVNLAGDGTGNGFSGITAAGLSEDLRYVVFFSEAGDVASGDTNGAADIFLRDRMANTTTLISRPADSPFGGNGDNFAPFISANGATVVFSSDATNLVADDTNAATDIFGISTTNKLTGFGATDLQLTVVGTLIQEVGSNYVTTVLITNAGPNHAPSFAVSNTLNPIISLVGATVTAGSFDTNSRRWSLPQLGVNDSAQISLIVSPTNVGYVTNDFRLVSVESIDTNTANNSGSLLTAIFRNGSATYLEPAGYTGRTNSPWLGTILSGLTVLEDFEDGALVNGVTGTADQILEPGTATDSVDADDGTLDGFGTNGHSAFSSNAVTGITFTFNSNILGALPTAAGLVWTDGGGAVIFEGFGPDGRSLGTFGTFGTTGGSVRSANDLFFGVTNPPGISAIRVNSPSGAIEVDHLQFAVQPGVAIPAGLVLWFAGDGSIQAAAGTNTAALQNGATFGPGQVGQAFQFDGVDDFVQIANTATSLPPAFTLEFWMNSAVNLNAQSGLVPFVVMLDPVDQFENVAKGFDFYYQNGALRFGMAQDTGGGSVPLRSIVSHTNDIASNTWRHVAGSLSNGVQRLYLDGRLVATQALQGAVKYTPAPLLLGRTLSAAGFTATGLTPFGGVSATPANYQGRLDELSFYDSVLDASVVADLYRQAGAGKVPPLLSILNNNGRYEVAWPQFQPNFDVQVAGPMAPRASWGGLGVAASVSNGLVRVPINTTGTAGFFRLGNTSPSAGQQQP